MGSVVNLHFLLDTNIMIGDAIIGATAKSRGLTLLTLDDRLIKALASAST
jgi:predicted nucleic acid-binding protein